MRMRLRYRLVLMMVFVGVLGQGAILAQDDGEGDDTTVTPVSASSAPVLNIAIGVDVSGSHYANATGDQEIPGVRARPNIGQANIRATDPTNMRFDSITKILTWLGQNAESLGVTVNVNLITFSNAASAWNNDWRNVSAFANSQLVFSPPTSTTGTGNWAVLAREAERVFADNNNSNANARNILIVITDGVSCSTISSGCPEADGAIETHLSTVNFSTPTHLLLTPLTVNKALFRAGYVRTGTPLLDNVEALISATGGNFYDFDNIDEMPSVLTQLLLLEIGKSKGTLELPEGDLDVRDTDLNWAQINPSLSRVTDGRFDVPYYQAQANMLFLLSRTNITPENRNQPISNVPLTFNLTGNTRPLTVPTGEFLGNAYLYQFPSPPQGIITASRPEHKLDGFIFYTPAQARLSVVPEVGNAPTQYEPIRLVYQLFNTDGAPLTLAQNALPNVSATARVGNNDNDLFAITDFTRVTLPDDSLALQSDLFFLAENRTYTFTIDAQPQTAWTDNNTLDYAFLTPNPAFVTVSPVEMTFIADIGEAGGTTTLNTSRDSEIPILVRVEVNGAPYPIPNGVTASLVTEPIAGQPTTACESVSPAVFNPDTINGVGVLRAGVTFAESGQCRLVVSVTFNDVVLPINGRLTVPSASRLSRLVDVDDTTRLAVGTFNASYTMDEYRDVFTNIFTPNILAWAISGTNAPFPPGSLLFEVRLTNENGTALTDFPEFAPDATFPDRPQGCVSTSPRPVPFQLQIFNNVTGSDAVVDFNICLDSRPEFGVYQADITKLPAGSYTINVILDDDATTLNRARFSYVAGIPDVYSLPLTVTTPFTVTLARLMIWGLIVLVVFIVLVSLRWIFIKYYFSGRYPLSGKIQIVIQFGTTKYAIWEKELPTKHTITYKDGLDVTQDMLRLGIVSIKVTTDKDHQMSKDKMAQIYIDTTPYILVSGEEKFITQIGNYHYFVTKDTDYPLREIQ